MPLFTRCTSVQIPNATRARTTNRTMMMMAMVSFFLTMMAVFVGLLRGGRWVEKRALRSPRGVAGWRCTSGNELCLSGKRATVEKSQEC